LTTANREGSHAAPCQHSRRGESSRAANFLWFCWYPAFDAFAVPPTLTVPFLLARCCLPVSLLGFLSWPFSRCLPAALAAIALVCLPGMKALFASF